MKQLTNYQRVSNYLVKIFKAINEEYFNNELEIPTITIQSTVGAYGHVSVQKVWHNNDTATHELNLSADYLNRPIENTVATLIHEASHLYALQNGIKDTSNRGVYHNKNFKKIAEERTFEKKAAQKISVPIDMEAEMDINEDNLKNAGYSVLKELYKQLELDKFWKRKLRNTSIKYDLEAVFRLLLFSRILF